VSERNGEIHPGPTMTAAAGRSATQPPAPPPRHGHRSDDRQVEDELEGRRRPAVHAAIISGRVRINGGVGHLLATAGCKQRWEHATALVSYLDGLVHDHLLHPEVAAIPPRSGTCSCSG
jgi:hypothetical protein